MYWVGPRDSDSYSRVVNFKADRCAFRPRGFILLGLSFFDCDRVLSFLIVVLNSCWLA